MQTHIEKHANLRKSQTHNTQEDLTGLLKMWLTFIEEHGSHLAHFHPLSDFKDIGWATSLCKLRTRSVTTSHSSKPRGQTIWKDSRSSIDSLKDSMYDSTAAESLVQLLGWIKFKSVFKVRCSHLSDLEGKDLYQTVGGELNSQWVLSHKCCGLWDVSIWNWE